MGLLINQGMLGEVGGFRAQTFFPIDPHRVTPPAPNPRFLRRSPQSGRRPIVFVRLSNRAMRLHVGSG